MEAAACRREASAPCPGYPIPAALTTVAGGPSKAAVAAKAVVAAAALPKLGVAVAGGPSKAAAATRAAVAVARHRSGFN